MKRLSVFISVFLSSFFTSWACGPYYPFGDDVRFGLLNVEKVGLEGYSPFNYTWNNYYWRNDSGIEEIIELGRIENIKLWAERYQFRGNISDVDRAIYSSHFFGAKELHYNSFVQLVIQKNDFEAIDYINFAKSCETLNASWLEDPWERGCSLKGKRSKFIDQAMEKAADVIDKEIEKRYVFLALRLAFYNEDLAKVETLYKQYFSKREVPDIIDSWALYYRAKLLPTGPKQNFLLSKSFLGAVEKRVAISREFYRKVPVDSTLSYANSDLEKANVLLVYNLRKLDPALEEIKQMQRLSPGFKGTDFLLIRELAKLEDWILTPRYTNFDPAILSMRGHRSVELTELRLKGDTKYAERLLAFVQSMNRSLVFDAKIWQLAEAYLLYMLRDFSKAKSVCNAFMERSANKEYSIYKQFQLINALCGVASHKSLKKIGDDLMTLVVDQKKKNNNRFLFALARELEFIGNSKDAAILLSGLDKRWGRGTKPVFWRTQAGHHTLYQDFYSDYFFYMDAAYTAEQVKELIGRLESKEKRAGADKDYYAYFDEREIWRLYDLLGTKYFRMNLLENAEKAFSKIDSGYWFSKWQYKTYLDANPFYTNYGNEHHKTKADTIRFNKWEVVNILRKHLKKANDEKNDDRAYHYFVAASCYLNTSHHGNSWIVRRYFWSRNINPTGLPDDDEFFRCQTARSLYLKAAEYANTTDFKVLSIRMAARCKDYEIRFSDLENMEYQDWNERMKKNPYHKKIQDDYASYYDNMFDFCYGFDQYFNNR